MNDAVTVLRQVREYLLQGDGPDALRLLSNYPTLYQQAVAGVIRALESDPDGYITSANGVVYSTRELIQMVRRGHWNPVLLQLLLSEVEMMLRQLGG